MCAPNGCQNAGPWAVVFGLGTWENNRKVHNRLSAAAMRLLYLTVATAGATLRPGVQANHLC